MIRDAYTERRLSFKEYYAKKHGQFPGFVGENFVDVFSRMCDTVAEYVDAALTEEHPRQQQQPKDTIRFLYLTPVPRGHDTVLGYLVRHRPDLLAHMDSTPDATRRDGFWLMHRCREKGIEPVKVRAPKIMRDQGVFEVNAYPVALLARRFG